MASSPTLSNRIPPILILTILAIFGLDALILQLNRNGYTAMFSSIIRDPLPRFLPDTDRLLVKQYTGFKPLDYFFVLGNVFWANVTDGSRPELSLFMFCFGGQLIATFMVFIIEGQRTVGLAPVVLNGAVWLWLVQSVGFGFVAPLYYAIHLFWTSKASWAERVHVRDYLSLHTVVPSVLLGYIVPVIFMVYPFSNYNVRQWSNAVWSMAPFYIFALQIVFTGLLKRLSVGQDANKSKVVLDKAALRHAYSFAWNIAVVSQITTYIVLLTSSFLPKNLASALTASKVFVPDAAPHSYTPMSSAAAATHNFLIYDFATGSLAGLVWAVYQLLEVKPELKVGEERMGLVRGVVRSLLLSGPGGALVAVMQHRDESVLSAEAKSGKMH